MFTSTHPNQTQQRATARGSNASSRSEWFSGTPNSQFNVSQIERILSAAAGGTLALYALSRKSPFRLAAALAGGALMYRGVTGWCHLYQALNINTAELPPQASIASGEGFKIETSITIGRDSHELYRFWRKLSNLPRVLRHIKSVNETDSIHSHWTVAGPMNTDIEWDAEIIEDKPGDMIAWRSLEGADISTAGSIHFRATAGGSDTEVRVVLRYSPPGGRIGAAVAQWLGQSPEAEVEEDLRAFKQMMESTGPKLDNPTRNERPQAQQGSMDGQPQMRYHIGQLVFDASGSMRGKVIGIEQLPIGTVDPMNQAGVLYSVEWEGSEKGEGQLRSDDLRPRLL